jgi:hypothetical protein
MKKEASMKENIYNSSITYVSKGSRSGVLAFLDGQFHLLVLEDTLYHVQNKTEQGDERANHYELNFAAGMIMHGLQRCLSVKELNEQLYGRYPAVSQERLSNECEAFINTLKRYRFIELLKDEARAQPAIEVSASVSEDIFEKKPAYEGLSLRPVFSEISVSLASNPPSESNPFQGGCYCC